MSSMLSVRGQHTGCSAMLRWQVGPSTLDCVFGTEVDIQLFLGLFCDGWKRWSVRLPVAFAALVEVLMVYSKNHGGDAVL